jgi:hypothetical protein
MIEIPLTQGKVALIDENDWELISQFKWCAAREGSGHWVAIADVGNKRYVKMHRLILGAKEGDEVDHINRDSLDNRRENLRLVTEAWQQNANKDKRANTSSIYKGVCWDAGRGRWTAYIDKDRRRKFLGRFKSEAEAALAYNEKAAEWFGEYAVLNEVVLDDGS